MAQVNVSGILEYFDEDVMIALERAISHEIPGAQFDRNRLLNALVEEIANQLDIWPYVSDEYVVA